MQIDDAVGRQLGLLVRGVADEELTADEFRIGAESPVRRDLVFDIENDTISRRQRYSVAGMNKYVAVGIGGGTVR